MIKWEVDDLGQLGPVYYHPNGRTQKVAWAPQPGSQEAYLASPIFEVLYHGNRGPGKTDALLMDFLQHVGQGWGPEWRGIVFRRTYPELEDVINKSGKWFPQIFPDAQYNRQSHTWTFKNGESLRFRHFAKPTDYNSYHGHAYTFIGWEEITNWVDNKCYLSMFSCCRSPIKGIPMKYRATTNPYGLGHCVDEGEVLTLNGWRDIRDIDVGEGVYSVDSSGTLVKSYVEQVHSSWYEGDIVRRDGRGIHMSFTPNHSLPRITNKGFDLVPFSELPGQVDILRQVSWKGKNLTEFSVPQVEGVRRTRLSQPKSISGEDFAELLGWFVSEGWTLDRDKEFGIAQCKVGNRERIQVLLDRCGFKYRISDNGFIVSCPHWWQWFRDYDGKCRGKRVPEWFLSLDTKYLQKFYDAAMLGDGCNGVYYTMSLTLADQMAEIGIKLGYSVYTSSRYRSDRDGAVYQVNFKITKSGGAQLITGNHAYDVSSSCKSVNVTREPFSGMVYCIGVPEHHTFIIRQKGCAWVSGNSWVKKRWKLPSPGNRAIGPIIKDAPTRDVPNPKPRVAIQGSLHENKILMHADPDYITNIAAAANNEAQLKAWLYCDWNVVAGGMFSDLWDDAYHVLPHIPFDKYPKRWKWDRSYDHGQSAPFSVNWYVESNGEPLKWGDYVIGGIKGDVIQVAEWYGCGKDDNTGLNMLNSQIAQSILDREDDWGIRHKVRPGPADSAIFNRTQAQESVAKDMQAVGVRWESVDKSPGSRVQGWQKMREYLAGAVPINGFRESPGLFFTERCINAVQQIPVLPRDEKNMDDVSDSSEDHIADSIRYRLWHTRKQAKRRSF